MALKPLLAIGVLAIFSIQAAYSAEFLPIFDKSSYSIGESPIITLQDSSKNNLIDTSETIYITIQSDSYSEGIISDSEFVNALQYLISQGIISV